MTVVFRMPHMGLGQHPLVPPGTVFFHPRLLDLLGGFIVEGDILKVEGMEVEVLASELAFPPLELNGRIVYAGGIFLHGDSFVPPLTGINEGTFRALVEAFKKGPEPSLLYPHGIPDDEKYLHLVGPFFGYHVPNAVQLADERDWRELMKAWGGSVPEEWSGMIELVEHVQTQVIETGINGIFPIKTPWKAFICPNGCVSPFEECPVCGQATRAVKLCPLCGGLYTEGDRCPRDGTPLLERFPLDPNPLIERLEAREGKVGELRFLDGPPEDIRKAFLRKKTNVSITESGVMEISVPPFPGDRNTLPEKLVDPLLRVYRFLSLYTGKPYPTRREELVGRKVVLLSDKEGFPVEIEAVGGDRFTLRKELFYALPKKRVRLAVLEDVELNGRDIVLRELEGGRDFPYEPHPLRSLFEGEVRRDALIERYVEVVRRIGADPAPVVFLLHPVLRERERKLWKTTLYRCESCGAEYPRPPLKGVCVWCGGTVRPEGQGEEPTLEDLIEKYKSSPEVHSYLLLFRKRWLGKVKQKSIVELF